MAWLHKQRKAVDEKCRLVGSDGKLDELIEWHRKTKQDIETHRGVRDSILLISDRSVILYRVYLILREYYKSHTAYDFIVLR